MPARKLLLGLLEGLLSLLETCLVVIFGIALGDVNTPARWL